MPKKVKIRSIVLGIFRRKNEILVLKGYDPKKKETFYRPLGGGIEFGESSREALIREIEEELSAEISNVKLLGVLESIFVYLGRPGHEHVFICEAKFKDSRLYQKKKIPMVEGERRALAEWVDLKNFRSGKKILYPDGLSELLDH